MGRTPWERGFLSWFVKALISGKGNGDFMPLYIFLFLGKRSKPIPCKFGKLWSCLCHCHTGGLDLLVAAFSLPLHLTEEPGLPLALCNTKLHSSRVAWPRQCSSPQWVGLASWLREAGGECVPTYSVPYLCPSVQPAKKKVSFQPASNTRCPPSAVSSAAAWNRDMSWNTQDTKNFFEAFLIEVNSLGYIWSAEKRQTVQESSHSHASSWTME